MHLDAESLVVAPAPLLRYDLGRPPLLLTRVDLEQRLLDYLQNHGSDRFRAKELARRLGLRDRDDYVAFRETLDRLADAGQVRRVGQLYGYAPLRRRKDGNAIVGRLIVHPQGFGFVTVEGEANDYFVRASAMGSALDGDLVELAVRSANPTRARSVAGEDTRTEAIVTNVVERGRSQIVGTFTRRGAGAQVAPDDARVPRIVWVNEGDFGGAQDGDKVTVAIRDYGETPDDALRGFVTRVLGPATDPHVRVLALALSQGIRADFPEAVERQAEAIPVEISAGEVARRVDFRQHRVFTIDPVDAKDFDDAIHVTRLENGNVEVGVHIADVSHFIPEGSALDREAYERATSVYLVDRVIPMLPEHLSNGVCSLVPHQDRLVYSCVMEVTPGGDLLGWRIAEGVIHSHHRFSYEGAQAVLDGREDHPFADDLRLAHETAQALTKKRMAGGAIDFEQTEVKILLDENGHAVGVQRKERQATNRLIEEFMLLANRAVATQWRARPFVYRVHEPPKPERIAALADYVKPFGLSLPHADGVVEAHDLARLLDRARGTDEGIVVTQAALRAMSKARYSPHNAGHFGLGFSHYTHFTSPIRRYPDLIVHRLSKRYFAGQPGPEVATLETQAEHCSVQEREAEEAERESVKLKQVEYLQDRVGEAFDGVVTGAAKFGVFVEISAVLAEGLLHVRELRDDRFDYDERRLALVGRFSGQTYRPGTPVRVVVLKADVDTRQIDLALAHDGPPPPTTRPAPTARPDGKHLVRRGGRHASRPTKRRR